MYAFARWASRSRFSHRPPAIHRIAADSTASLNPADIQPINSEAAEAESHFDADTSYSKTGMPRDTTYFLTTGSRTGGNTRPWLRPVESSAAVWNAALREGRHWWNTLSFWQRLKVRVFG